MGNGLSKHLTVAYITSRKNPRIEWFYDSLHRELDGDYSNVKVVVVSRFELKDAVKPKPCVWQGEHRLTKEDWFAASNARNTALCLAPDGWIAYVDDLSVLIPGWFNAVRDAINGNYLVCGAYQKVKELVVEQGEVKSFTYYDAGNDCRRSAPQKVTPCGGDWLYGCSCAMPVDSLLEIGGWLEIADGMGYEDTSTGIVLNNAGYGFKYDKRMLTYESFEAHFEEPPCIRQDPGKSPLDKSHALVRIVRSGQKFFDNYYQGGIRSERERVLRGEPFFVRNIPDRDWFNGKLLSEL